MSDRAYCFYLKEGSFLGHPVCSEIIYLYCFISMVQEKKMTNQKHFFPQKARIAVCHLNKQNENEAKSKLSNLSKYGEFEIVL